MDKFDLLKIKNFCKRPGEGDKTIKLPIGRKPLQTTSPTKAFYLESIKNSQNSTVKTQTIQLEDEQKT